MTKVHKKNFVAEQNSEHIYAAKILLVDDERVQRTMLRHIMKSCGFNNFMEAENGKDAIKIIEEWKPDIVFLDINMPVMGGIEVCSELRSKNILPDLIVIAQTATSNSEFITKTFEAGVSDFISKPFNPAEVSARARAHLERKLLKDANERDYKRIREELNEVMSLQYLLLPQEEDLGRIQNEMRLDIAQYFHPCAELGGDFLAVQQLSKDKVVLLAADMSGHGITASVYTFALHTVLAEYIHSSLPPGEILEQINKKLFPLMAIGKFATMFLGIVDTKNAQLEYAAAASPQPILFSEHQAKLLDTSGLLLGIKQNTKYETRKVPFGKGDLLCIYSDALTETPDANGKTLTEEELISLLKSRLSLHSSEILKSVISKFFIEYATTPPDDLSFLICKHE